jgi:hypothetical protein
MVWARLERCREGSSLEQVQAVWGNYVLNIVYEMMSVVLID